MEAAPATVSCFPDLTPHEFSDAIAVFNNVCLSLSPDALLSTAVVVLQGLPSLRIITRLPLTTATHISRSITDGDLLDAELELHDEGDDSRLVDKARTVEDGKQCIVTYDILLSPIYCVPVLYFHLIPVRPLEDLVPKLLRSQMQHVGVMGAVSTTDHPVTGLPVYFVHPCNTANAMRAVCASGHISPVLYLIKWLGLVGGSVGLSVPLEVALACGR